VEIHAFKVPGAPGMQRSGRDRGCRPEHAGRWLQDANGQILLFHSVNLVNRVFRLQWGAPDRIFGGWIGVGRSTPPACRSTRRR
jgi:hypothetical protein